MPHNAGLGRVTKAPVQAHWQFKPELETQVRPGRTVRELECFKPEFKLYYY